MRLFTNKRVRDIFIHIAQGTASQMSLAKEMNVSTRTIRSDLKELSDVVADAGNRLIYDRRKGFFIQVDNQVSHHHLLEQCQKPWTETRSTAERRRALLTLLLRQDADVALEALESTWFISIYTLRNDIALLRRHFDLYGIAIHSEKNDRYRLLGTETAIRRCMYDLLLRARETEKEDYALFDASLKIAEVKLALGHYAVAHGLAISDVNLRFLALICGISAQRMLQGNWLHDYPFEAGAAALNDIAAEITRFIYPGDAAIPAGEVNYTAMHLAAFCTQPLDCARMPDANTADRAVMNHFLSYVSASWFCDVFYDESSRASLLNHIKAMRIRVNNGITIINPLIEQIKRHYPLMYEMTLAAFSELEHFFSGAISDDEIGYLVMHIGAILEETQLENADNRLNALVVSEQGNASTRLVCQKITRMYPHLTISRCISVEQYKALLSVDERIVISLVGVEEKNRKVIHLPPLPERWQLENMKYFLSPQTPPPEAMVNYFSVDHFFVFDSQTHSKASLLPFLCTQLARKGRVDEHYLDSVLERENRASTLLDDKIAIPHPLGLVALSTMVTVAVFPDGIEWDAGKTVKLVFMLAVSEDAFVDSMLIYDYLTNILDDDVIDALSQCADYREFMALSQRYFL